MAKESYDSGNSWELTSWSKLDEVRANSKLCESFETLKPATSDILPPARWHLIFSTQLSTGDQVFKRMSLYQPFSFKSPEWGWHLLHSVPPQTPPALLFLLQMKMSQPATCNHWPEQESVSPSPLIYSQFLKNPPHWLWMKNDLSIVRSLWNLWAPLKE